MIRVFVSSVARGLLALRQQIIAHLRAAGYDVGAMESFGAQPDPSIEVCLRELRKADVVVLVLGPRYGSVLPQGISYTQAEFREARALGIPVLAFRLPDDPAIDTHEQAQLSAFVTEIGSVTTYAALGPRDAPELLSGQIQAALTAARDRGQLGGRYSPFQRYDRYFAKQLGDNPPLFNHEGPLFGREIELDRAKKFLQSAEAVLLVKATGGSGKSRLLLELAKHSSQVSSGPQLLFVDPGAQWTAEDINRLPVTPLVLIIDDAHRRADLDRLIAACLQINLETRFILSCRPSAVSIVSPHIAPITKTTGLAEIALMPLSQDDAVALAQHHLGTSMQQMAARLVRVADKNPLVITVGGQCIAENKVAPEVLERTPDVFRSVVLDRLLEDPGLNQTDSVIRRKLLEIVAAVGPVVIEGDDLMGKLSSSVDEPLHEIRRQLAALERAGFLLRRGRLVRVSPDVLADHLLYRAAVDDAGEPTGFIEEMVKLFSPGHLENILANAAELDWRASAMATHESVLATTWRDLAKVLPEATNPQRATLLEQLRRTAAFAPEEVLRLAEWLITNRQAPPDESLRKWGLDDTFDRVADRLTELFAFIATHPDFTKRCLRSLWALAADDGRPTNPNPGHPRRKLEDLLKYERRTDWRSTEGVHAKVVRFLVERLEEQPRTDDRSWAVTLLGTALHRLGEANEANRLSFTFGQFSLAGYLADLTPRRTEVISCLRALALGPRISEAAVAIHELSELLSLPRGPFGKLLEAGEISVWLPEASRAIDVIAEIARNADDDIVRYFARRSLREASRDHWPELSPKLDEALRDVPAPPAEDLYDLLVGLPWPEQLDDYDEEERRVGELCAIAARAFWNRHGTARQIVSTLLAADAAVRAVMDRGDSHAGRLVRALLKSRPNQAEEMVNELVRAGEGGWKYLRPALLAWYDEQPANAIRAVDRLSQDPADGLRAYATDPLQWMVDSSSAAEILRVLDRLSRDSSVLVRRVAAQVLRRFREHESRRALEILSAIDWSNDLSIATAVLDVLHPKYGLDPDKLEDPVIDRLLDRIQTLQTLEGHAHDILEFIRFASTRRPMQTVSMLLNRVRAVDEHSGTRGDDRWTPLPYNGHGLSLPGLSTSPQHKDLLRQVRDAYGDSSLMVRFWLPTLFGAVASDLQMALVILREWSESDDPEKIIGAAHLLGAFEHSIVFSVDSFVADLLDAAASSSQECLDRTRSELFGIAISGVHSGAPGQPAPRYVSDKASAQALATKYADRPTVRDFYETLVRHAESSIERDMMQWEEFGDE